MTKDSDPPQFWPTCLLNCHGFLFFRSQLPLARGRALSPVAKVLVRKLTAKDQPQLQDMERGEEGQWLKERLGLAIAWLRREYCPLQASTSTNTLLALDCKRCAAADFCQYVCLRSFSSSIIFIFHSGFSEKGSARFYDWDHRGRKSHDGLSAQMPVMNQ